MLLLVNVLLTYVLSSVLIITHLRHVFVIKDIIWMLNLHLVCLYLSANQIKFFQMENVFALKVMLKLMVNVLNATLKHTKFSMVSNVYVLTDFHELQMENVPKLLSQSVPLQNCITKIQKLVTANQTLLEWMVTASLYQTV